MGKLLVLVLALTAPSFALAAPYQDQHGVWWDLPLPPAHYFDREPLGNPEVRFLPEGEIMSICRQANGKAENFGCAFPPAFRTPGLEQNCPVYVSEDLPKILRDAVHFHEVAHCFGWGADHPQD